MVFSWQLWQRGTLLLSIVALIEACQLVMQPQRLQQGNAREAQLHDMVNMQQSVLSRTHDSGGTIRNFHMQLSFVRGLT